MLPLPQDIGEYMCPSVLMIYLHFGLIYSLCSFLLSSTLYDCLGNGFIAMPISEILGSQHPSQVFFFTFFALRKCFMLRHVVD